MQRHTEIYRHAMDYAICDFAPCEMCGSEAVDVHHISSRGMGGSSLDKDFIENLMGLCRGCHWKFGDKKTYYFALTEIHLSKMRKHGLTPDLSKITWLPSDLKQRLEAA